MENINPSGVEIGNSVKSEKLQDVRQLLEKHYGADWETLPQLNYYQKVLSGMGHIGEGEDEIENNTEAFAMEEVLDFV